MTVQTWGPLGGKVRTVGLQLKATSNPRFVSHQGCDSVAFSLEGEHYNDLCSPASFPRFLVVVALPQTHEPWVHLRSSIVALRTAVWWTAVSGPTTSQQTKTVHLPVTQRLDDQAFADMLAAA